METFHRLFFISFFSIIIFNSANAISVRRDVSNPPPSSKPSMNSYQIFKVPKTKSVDPALKKICDSTDYSALCISSITPYLNGKTDTISVLEMAMKASTNQTKMAISKITKLVGSPATPPQTVSILNDCKDSYNDALENFQYAMGALPDRDIGTMNSMLSASITDYGDCEDAFAEQTSPLADYSEKLMHMVDNCLAIVSLAQMVFHVIQYCIPYND
ncbi:hypothetical protein F0562_005856 [Nyssa sinensis]|uniref:Pectinesterase inhibitor domain-containing protein n=1 Tax=Nyssa sinensis TaxID=561372 RepID=A0A5J5AKP9_9ASTE|nr:hypothetical protein F0562_005856 [Nyssa sinensis]